MKFNFPESKKTAKEMISDGFRSLRARGWRCRANFSCCLGCGCAELADKVEPGQRWAFYHRQDNEGLTAIGRGSRHGCYLAWGVNIDGPSHDPRVSEAADELVAAMQDAGLVVEWEGRDPTKRIWVQHPDAAAEEADKAAKSKTPKDCAAV